MIGIIVALAVAAIGWFLGTKIRESIKYARNAPAREAQAQRDAAQREAQAKWLAENPPITDAQRQRLFYAIDLYYTEWLNHIGSRPAVYYTDEDLKHSNSVPATCGITIIVPGTICDFGTRGAGSVQLVEIDLYYDHGLKLPQHLLAAGWYVSSGNACCDVGTTNYDYKELVNEILFYLKRTHSGFVTQHLLKYDGGDCLQVTEEDYKNRFQ